MPSVDTTPRSLVEAAWREIHSGRDFVRRTGGRSDGDQVVLALALALERCAVALDDALAVQQGGEAKDLRYKEQEQRVRQLLDIHEDSVAMFGKPGIFSDTREAIVRAALSSLPLQQGAVCSLCNGRGELYMSAPGTWTSCQCRKGPLWSASLRLDQQGSISQPTINPADTDSSALQQGDTARLDAVIYAVNHPDGNLAEAIVTVADRYRDESRQFDRSAIDAAMLHSNPTTDTPD